MITTCTLHNGTCTPNAKLDTWTVKAPTFTPGHHIRQVTETHQLTFPDRDHDPIQYHHYKFHKNDDPLLHKKAYLTLSVIDNKKDVLKTVSSELITDGKGEEEQSDIEKNKLEIICFSL